MEYVNLGKIGMILNFWKSLIDPIRSWIIVESEADEYNLELNVYQ